MIGPEAEKHPELIAMFLKLDNDVDLAMRLGTMLPSWLPWVVCFKINADYDQFRKVIKLRKERHIIIASSHGCHAIYLGTYR